MSEGRKEGRGGGKEGRRERGKEGKRNRLLYFTSADYPNDDDDEGQAVTEYAFQEWKLDPTKSRSETARRS